MRHFAVPKLFCALLYGALLALTTHIARAADDVPVADASALPHEAHIALLLPLHTPAFSSAANAVRQGFVAAAQLQNAGLPVRIYSINNEDPENVLAVHQQAIDAGAQLIVGPLTRDGVTALANSNELRVPVLSLNFPNAGSATSPLLYPFGLAIETEARQVAQMAYSNGMRKALLVGDSSPLSKRMRDAFASEFVMQGGQLIDEFANYASDRATLDDWRQSILQTDADMAFIALDATRTSIARPYLPRALALYATSQINAAAGNTGPYVIHALDGIRFVDMPWLLMPDHAAVMAYPRAPYGNDYNLQRLYALGIDAFRLAALLTQHPKTISLDGVTGHIEIAEDHTITRTLLPAQIMNGAATVMTTAISTTPAQPSSPTKP